MKFVQALARQIIADRACRWGSWSSASVADELTDTHGIVSEDALAAVIAFKESVAGMDFLGTCADRR